MGMQDNPSADKFGPPPGEERFEAPKPRRRLQWSAAFVTLGLLIARVALDHIHATGRTAYFVIAGIVGMAVGEFIRTKRARDAREETNRPNPHQVTPQ